MRISDWSSDVCSSDLDGGAALRIARQQRLVLFGEVEQDRAAFEQADIAVAQHGHLAPRLVAIMLRRAIDRADQMLGIVDLHFLARPARAQVADRKSTRLNSSH